MRKRKKSNNKKFAIPVAILSFFLIIILIASDKAGLFDKALYSATGGEIYADSVKESFADDGIILTAHFIDVGQGDCSLFISGDESMLIDGGEAEYSPSVIAALNEYGVDELDYVVATHAHSDHIGGLADIITNIRTDNIIISEPSDKSAETSVYEKFLDAAESSSANITLAKTGYTFTLGEAQCEILAPFEVSQTEENNNSIVMYISAGENSFLMTGDAEKTVENDIVASYPNLKADILKVGHHGSKTSSSESFISLIRPEVGIISVGKDNMYKHPSDETIDRFDGYGVEYYRTDVCGTVTVDCTYDNYTVSTER